LFEGKRINAQASPLIYVDTEGMNLELPEHQQKINQVVYKALEMVHPFFISGQTLIKVHVGEPNCVTKMKPEYVKSSVKFLKDKGVKGVVTGDTTVAYSGPRGHKQNPGHDVSGYKGLAHEHGWSVNGPAGVPFVVLDRPVSAIPGKFEFSDESFYSEAHGIRRFQDFYPASGFKAASFVINHAHLTLHGLAGVAGCVKSIAMGCSALKGKLRMHQSLLPHFNQDLCEACLECIDNCPEEALLSCEGESCPVVDQGACIGCGECEAVCPNGAVTLKGHEITDWQRGEDTLYLCMADYALGPMGKNWENIIHVLHMYDITERCDCLDKRQEPMIKRDLGFLIGKNPFAVDRLGARMLAKAADEEGRSVEKDLIGSAEKTADYVTSNYGIVTRSPKTRIPVL